MRLRFILRELSGPRRAEVLQLAQELIAARGVIKRQKRHREGLQRRVARLLADVKELEARL